METEPKEWLRICGALSGALSERMVLPWLEMGFGDEKMNRKRRERVFYLFYRLALSFRVWRRDSAEMMSYRV